MLREFDSILKKAATAKGLLVIILSLLIGIFIWRNFNFLTEVTFSIKNPAASTSSQQPKESTNTRVDKLPQLSIGKVILPPAPKSLPAIMVFEISNPGTGTTNNIHISLDLGSAIVTAFEIIGANSIDNQQALLGTSILSTSIDKIGPSEHVFLYVQCSQPIFDKITISSPDVFSPVELLFNTYIKNNQHNNSTEPDGFRILLYFVLGTFIIVMGIYMTLLLITFLNKHIWPKA